MKIRLQVRTGELVGHFETLPYQTFPEIMQWGARFFMLKAQRAKASPGFWPHPDDVEAVYAEGFCSPMTDTTMQFEGGDPWAKPLPEPATDPTHSLGNGVCLLCGAVSAELLARACVPPIRVTTDGKPPTPGVVGAPQPINPETGQHRAYWVLSDAEIAKGFVKPVRSSYRHTGPKGGVAGAPMCLAVTSMGERIANTYARDHFFYSSTFCLSCGVHLPLDQFHWLGADGRAQELMKPDAGVVLPDPKPMV